MKEALLGIAIVVAALMFLVWVPFLLIWSVNTLFGTDITYGLNTWAATVILLSVIRIYLAYSKKD